VNALETGLAFLEGVALIVSPCILPALPLVLSASAEGGKKRPFGIIAGFVLAFSLFALTARSLVEVLGVDIDAIKTVSLWLLFLFGLVLFSPRLSEIFSRLTRRAANIGSRALMAEKGGFFSGLAIGALIGLVWTPCAGPILAVVLVQVIRQQTDLAGALLILSFAIGAGLPMLAIALAGRSVIGKFVFFTRHAEGLRRAFGIAIILSVAYIAFGADVEARFISPVRTQSGAAQPPRLEDALEHPYPAPMFAGVQEWINSPPLSMARLKGKVVLIDFWTYSCINCIRTLPYLTAWDKKYRDQGLVIVGVHAPEFEFEKNFENVRRAVALRGIAYPVALDNGLATWQEFNNRYWPAHYLIDRDGLVVYTHFGEGKYDVTENNIRYLLGLKGKAESAAPKELPAGEGQTPETYLGYARAERFTGTPGLRQEAPVVYQHAGAVPPHHWTLRGTWKAGKEKSVAAQGGAVLQLNFTAKKVFLVMGNAAGTPVQVGVKLDGVALPDVTVAGHALYELVSQPSPKNGLLEITARMPGLEVYAFTFGG